VYSELASYDDEKLPDWLESEELPEWIKETRAYEASLGSVVSLLESWALFDPQRQGEEQGLPKAGPVL